MSDILRLRDYQEECIQSLERDWDKGLCRIAAVLPTGAGKTVIFSHLASRFRAANPGSRILILAHTDELVTQAHNKIRSVAPTLRVGIVKAGRNEVTADVIVASVQTLRAEKRRARIKKVGLIIVDECHHATAKTYRDVMEHFGAFTDGCPVRVAGFTATLARGDKAKLSDIWEEVSYRKDLPFMIGRGYLLDVRGKRIEVPDLDLSNVRKSRGDYSEGDLGEAITASMAPEVVAKSYVEHASDRSGLVFTPTVATAYLMAERLNEIGIRTETVHGALATNDRRDIIGRLESGETQVITNCMALTEGFDSPRVSAVVIARPTRSAPLYQQMVGRGLRLYPGQTEALVLDVVGASKSHDLRSLVDLSTRRDLSECDDCSLMEMEEVAERNAREVLEHYGPVDAVEFDPLVRASKRTWLTTVTGTYFLSAGEDAYVFLCPSQTVGAWDVAWCAKAGKSVNGSQGGFTPHVGVGMDYALAWGEEAAEDIGGAAMDTYTAKSASWRRKPASENQVRFATRLGLTIPLNSKAGDVSVLIDSHLASQRIDPVVIAILSQRTSA